MTKKDCKWIACVYALISGCSIELPPEHCVYRGDGTCECANCRDCARQDAEPNDANRPSEHGCKTENYVEE